MLGSLLQAVQEKAAAYKSPALAALFAMNNVSYVVRACPRVCACAGATAADEPAAAAARVRLLLRLLLLQQRLLASAGAARAARREGAGQ